MPQGNPGRMGACAALQRYRKVVPAAPRRRPITMELMAVIEGLQALKRSCVVDVTTDSRYVNRHHAVDPQLKRNGWRTAANASQNDDLWRMLDEAVARHQISWHWVRAMPGIRKMSAPMRWQNLGGSPRWRRRGRRRKESDATRSCWMPRPTGLEPAQGHASSRRRLCSS